MTDQRAEQSDLTSLSQLVQDLIGGTLRRNTFSQWELELLLDVQTCRIRKSARANALRRYLKTVQQNYASGAPASRFSQFVEAEQKRTLTPVPGTASNALIAGCSS